MSRPRHTHMMWIGGVALACSVAYTGWIGVDPELAVPSQPGPQAAKAHPPGFWVKVPEARRVDAAEHEWISRLEAIGYLPGVEETEGPHEVGVTLRTPGASDAPRLYVSGHAPEATLIDVEGRVLHRWQFAPDRIWKDVSPERAHSMANFRRAYLLAGASSSRSSKGWAS